MRGSWWQSMASRAAMTLHDVDVTHSQRSTQGSAETRWCCKWNCKRPWKRTLVLWAGALQHGVTARTEAIGPSRIGFVLLSRAGLHRLLNVAAQAKGGRKVESQLRDNDLRPWDTLHTSRCGRSPTFCNTMCPVPSAHSAVVLDPVCQAVAHTVAPSLSALQVGSVA